MVKRILLLAFLITFGIIVVSIFATNPQKRVGSPVTEEFKRKEPILIRGSIPYWDQDKASASFSGNVSKFNYVSLYWYYLGADGQIKKYRASREDKNIIKFAHDNNIKVSAIITNNLDDEGLGWNSKRVEENIKDSNAREKHSENIKNLLIEKNFDGVIIDYELVRADQKENFTKFMEELSKKLKPENKLITVSLHPKTGNSINGEEIGRFQDWKELAKYADQLSIMSFGEHEDEGEPGPISSIPWMESIIGYVQSLKINPEKFFLGIGTFGYKWQTDSDKAAEGLTFEQVQKILSDNQIEVNWNETYKSPYFEYEKSGTEYVVWFENAQSVGEKLNLADKKGFGGVNFWRLGGEDPKIWELIKN